MQATAHQTSGASFMTTSETIHIYTDGACSGNPGPGGWACVILMGDDERHIFGGDPATTNQRMELSAALAGLELVQGPAKVKLYSDSEYLVKGMTEWMENWKRNDWRTANKKPVKNLDLWQRLDYLASMMEIEWIKVKGHDGHIYNELADKMAVEVIERYR